METGRPLFGSQELRRYSLILYVAIFGLIAVGTFFFVGYQRENHVIVRGVFINDLNLSGYTQKQAERLLRLHFNDHFESPIMLIDGDFRPSFSPKQVGFELDSSKLASDAFKLGHSGSFVRRIWERMEIRSKPKVFHPILKHRGGAVEEFYRLLESQINQVPIASRVTLLPNGDLQSTPSENGRRLHVKILHECIEEAIWSGEREIPLPIETLIPTLSQTQVEEWALTSIIGIFSTKFNPKQVDRSHNVELASTSIQNTLVLPGHTFSFNTTVGARITEQGYREAPIIVKNKMIPGVGGGVCQVSTTLYNALLLAGFSEIQRVNHSLPIAYVPLGRDATVVYGAVDFTFTNTNSTPVLLITGYNPSGILTVAVAGKKEHSDEIRLETLVKKKLPFTRIEINDPKLPMGEEHVEEEGKNGYIVELWRIRQSTDGKTVKEKVNQSYYPPVPSLVKVGTLPVVTSEATPMENSPVSDALNT